MYTHVRHPSYGGVFFEFAGLALLSPSQATVLACAVADRLSLSDADRLSANARHVIAYMACGRYVHSDAVHVAADAVRSRRETDREAALRKMERSGAIITTSEMAAFELLADAKHPRFKEVQALFKG